MNIYAGYNRVSHFAAKALRAAGLTAGTVPVTNSLGTRRALVVGCEDSRINRRNLGRGGNLRPVPDLDRVRAEIAAFQPQTTSEVLEAMAARLRQWGNEPAAEYFFRLERREDGQLVYKDPVNTSEARSQMLAVAFDGELSVKVDRDIYDGKIKGPVNGPVHLFSIWRYGINWLLIKLSAYLGAANTFVILPVFDGSGGVLGKVNLGLRTGYRLSRDKLEVLRLLADKIKATRIDRPAVDDITRAKIKSFVDYVRGLPGSDFIMLFLFVPLRLIDGTRKLVSLISSVMKQAREKEARAQAAQLRSVKGVVEALSATLGVYEGYTGGHCNRVGRYAEDFGRHLPDELWRQEIVRAEGALPEDPTVLAARIAELREEVYYHGVIHDLGKTGVEYAIVTKPGGLTPDERRKMETHPARGYEILMRVVEQHGFDEMRGLAETVLYHHLHWDGTGYTGYPEAGDGRRGKEIPLVAADMHLADTLHAMISRRVYQPAKSPERVVGELVRCCGTSFSPAIVETALERLAVTDLVSPDLMMEEIMCALDRLPKDGPSVEREELIQFLGKLEAGTGVEPLAAMVAGDKVLPETQALFAGLRQRSGAKLAEIQRRAALAREFIGWARARTDAAGRSLFDLAGDYNHSVLHEERPEPLWKFVGHLFAAWQNDRGQSLQQLTESVFAQHGGEVTAAFHEFFLHNFRYC